MLRVLAEARFELGAQGVLFKIPRPRPELRAGVEVTALSDGDFVARALALLMTQSFLLLLRWSYRREAFGGGVHHFRCLLAQWFLGQHVAGQGRGGYLDARLWRVVGAEEALFCFSVWHRSC